MGDLCLRKGYSRFTHPAGGLNSPKVGFEQPCRIDLNNLAGNDPFVKFDKNCVCKCQLVVFGTGHPSGFSEMMLSSPFNIFRMTNI